MKHLAQKAIALLLVGLMAAATVACSGDTSDQKDTTAAPGTTAAPADTTPAETESEYVYPDVDYQDYEFRMLNFDQFVNCSIRLDVESQSGDRLSDAIYERNRKVEEQLGIKIKEIQHPFHTWSTSQKELIDLVIKSVASNEDNYDVAFLNVNSNAAVYTGGNVVNLMDIEALNLDQPWWDRNINDALTVNGKLYMASTPLQLCPFGYSWCLLFNEDMMEDLQLEKPYQLVKDGKWTIDKLAEYAQKGANLNGDQSFVWNEAGNATYGIAAHNTAAHAFRFGMNNRMVVKNGDKWEFGIDNEHFYNTIEKLKGFVNGDTGFIFYNNGGKGTPGGYIETFASGRALFMTCELKAVMEERDMKDTFGLLPMPKFDETQQNYMSYIGSGTMLMTVPATNKDLNRTGVILDALTYESAKDVLPAYYDVTVSYQGLRNEASLEMLQIIRDSLSVDYGMLLSMSKPINSLIEKCIHSGEGEAASIVAANKGAVEENIATILKFFE